MTFFQFVFCVNESNGCMKLRRNTIKTPTTKHSVLLTELNRAKEWVFAI